MVLLEIIAAMKTTAKAALEELLKIIAIHTTTVHYLKDTQLSWNGYLIILKFLIVRIG